jgi:protein-disulfide isomerase
MAESWRITVPMLNLKRGYLWEISLLVSLGLTLLLLSPTARSAFGAEAGLVPAYGSGSYRLIIFADYFCQSCQRLEKELAGEIRDLIVGGGVKVSFVDLPVHRLTPLYARYFLYADKAAQSTEAALHAREVLVDTASRIGAITELQLEAALKARDVSLKSYDVKPVFARYNGMVQEYQVSGPPTFVFVYSDKDVRKYTGREKIMKGLAELRRAMERP